MQRLMKIGWVNIVRLLALVFLLFYVFCLILMNNLNSKNSHISRHWDWKIEHLDANEIKLVSSNPLYSYPHLIKNAEVKLASAKLKNGFYNYDSIAMNLVKDEDKGLFLTVTGEALKTAQEIHFETHSHQERHNIFLGYQESQLGWITEIDMKTGEIVSQR